MYIIRNFLHNNQSKLEKKYYLCDQRSPDTINTLYLLRRQEKKYNDKRLNMYVAKPIPTLTGEAADRFIEQMELVDSGMAPKKDTSAAQRAYDIIMERSSKILSQGWGF